jgi:dihydrofolate reductase
MRELTVDLFITVDGWAKGSRSPAYFGYGGPELQAWIDEQLAEPYVILMGGTTYRAMAEMSAGAADPASARMTELPKVVVSTTLEDPPAWANTMLVRDVATAVPALKNEPGDPLRVIGSLTLVRELVRLRLVDRLRLMVFPQVLGETGEEPFLREVPDVDLRLASARVLDGRLVLLDYRI